MNKHRVLSLAKSISSFLQELDWRHRDEGPPLPPPEHEFAYAQAINKWEDAGKPDDHFFSVMNDDDPMMLTFRHELTIKFGLPFLTQSEAEERKKRKPTVTEKVCEQYWLDIPGIEPFNL